MKEIYYPYIVHDHFMKQALQLAKKAEEQEEVPVGAVVVCQEMVIAKGHNMVEQLNDVTAHAEMIAITSASNHLNSKFLKGCALYVTLEPCPMCASALFWSQIDLVVYGATDEKRGFTRFTHQEHLLHPKTEIIGGILELECSTILQDFFKARR